MLAFLEIINNINVVCFLILKSKAEEFIIQIIILCWESG